MFFDTSLKFSINLNNSPIIKSHLVEIYVFIHRFNDLRPSIFESQLRDNGYNIQPLGDHFRMWNLQHTAAMRSVCHIHRSNCVPQRRITRLVPSTISFSVYIRDNRVSTPINVTQNPTSLTQLGKYR